MSAGEALAGAFVDWLRADPGLAAAVFDAPPVRAGLPFVTVEDATLQAVDVAGMQGRGGGVAVLVADGGERPVRLRALLAAVEARLETLPADLGGGWRLAALSLTRSRIVRTKDGWLARSEWMVRLYRAHS